MVMRIAIAFSMKMTAARIVTIRDRIIRTGMDWVMAVIIALRPPIRDRRMLMLMR